MRAFVRLRRPGALVAVPALAVLGLAGMPSMAGAAAAQPPPVVKSAAVAPDASPTAAPRFLSPLPTPALPAGIAQGCATPAHAGQMACDLLVNTQARPRAAIKPNVFPSGFGYGPADLQNAYGLTSAAAAPNTGTVAIVEAFNDPSAEADLGHYRSDAGLPACTVASGCLTIVNQAGATAPLPGTDPTGGWEAEESLDLDMVSAICPNCKILLVEANSANLTDLGPGVNYAALHAKFVSNSWGSGGEFIGENTFDSAFNHPGVAITAASGDFGYGTQYPADSQLVTSVGGTTLTGASPTTKGTETAWAGTGSGCSTLEPKPSWQTDTNPTTGCLNRTENDASAVADPSTGVAIYDTAPNTLGLASGYNEAGGTSAATPIIASTYALAGTPTAGTYPSSYPYQHTSAFNKVTSGSDGTCESTRLYLCNAADSLAGYNGPTGEGTPSGVTGFSEATTGNVVTVLNPGTVDMSDNVKLTLPIQATDSGSGQTLAYSAAGLPAGVAINPTTGVISGTDTGATGTAPVTVTATDGTSARGSVTFNLATVASMAASYHPASGPARLALGGKCLDDTGNSAANGTKIQIYTCNGDAAQNWEFAPDGFPGAPGVVLIHGKCLDILGLGTANGSKIQLWACSGAANQQWYMGGFGVLINPVSGKCLDDTGRSTTNGTQVQIWSCTGASNQTWTLTASPVQSGVPGKCLDDTGNSAANGTKIQIYTCNGGPAQKWVLAADGTLRVNGKCLDVTGLSLLDGAKIQLWACTGGSNQQWLVGPNGELINVNSSRCLDDTGGSTVNGTQLDQQDCYGSVPEVWAAT